MTKIHKVLLLTTVLLLAVLTAVTFGQRRERPPWEDRSPSVGKIVPESQIYDRDLNPMSVKDIYSKNALLIVQWGGCT